MGSEELIRILRQAMPELRARHGVLHLDLFGSYAKGSPRPDSDVDLLVTFEGEATFSGYMGLKEDLEALLGRSVDLVTATGLKPRIREAVLSELLHVA